jgi:hypothetical protein
VYRLATGHRRELLQVANASLTIARSCSRVDRVDQNAVSRNTGKVKDLMAVSPYGIVYARVRLECSTTFY